MKQRYAIRIYILIVTGIFSILILTYSCKKDDSNKPADETTVKDIDGNVYHTITITIGLKNGIVGDLKTTSATQTWMVENLKTTRYRNGDTIADVKEKNKWYLLYAAKTGALCCYNNDPALSYKYGKLYNFYAVADSRNIAPTGWHVATDDEWTTLINYAIANPGSAGSEAKALACVTDWASSSEAGAIGNDLTKNNTIGFSAVPGGFRHSYGEFNGVGENGGFWSSTEGGQLNSWYRFMLNNASNVNRFAREKEYGFSVRCVKNQ
jgi:uncharacterized protein (TIGR02145 family)